jgi:hypothetical protein
MLDFQHCILRLTRTGQAIVALAEDVPVEQARWKPSPDKWSVLEIVNHLVDEERADFRMRLEFLLHHPEREWPKIDPEGWARDHDYNSRDLSESLTNFKQERKASIDWLEELSDPQWENVYNHPSAGPLTAGSLMLSWLAHDLLHTRQICRVQWQYLTQHATPHTTAYAGDLV